MRPMNPKIGMFARLAGALVVALAGTSGCILLDLSKGSATDREVARLGYVAGTVASDSPETQWMVIYAAMVPCDEDWRELLAIAARTETGEAIDTGSEAFKALGGRLEAKSVLADHIVLQRPGFWYVQLAPGCYGIGAFADLNRNFRYDDEPVAPATASPDRLFELKSGDRIEGLELVIQSDARLSEGFDPIALQVRTKFRTHKEQQLISVGEVAVAGELGDLADEHFGAANAKIGYFEVFRFLWDVRPGIYFLEEYDPARIPVLFVHGALGYPQEFTALIESLDRERFQPWVFFYPSGARLGGLSEFLAQTVMSLQLRHGFDDLVVVAHSMGGLVSRDFILRLHASVVDFPVRVFVSLATPWGGVPSAASGVRSSPFVIASWRDIAPGSDFLAGLFFEGPAEQGIRRSLPEEVSFYLLFGVGDETIPLASAVRWEAARDARARWPLAYDHTGILGSPEAAELLGEILASEYR
jgi:pimeloyl-ACP methyl ester carboxylesterase